MFLFNPLLWLIDEGLQRIWPLSDPEPPRNATFLDKAAFEVRLFVKTVALVLGGLVLILAAAGLVLLLLIATIDLVV